VLVAAPQGVFAMRGDTLALVHPLPGPAESLLAERDTLWVGGRGGVHRLAGTGAVFEALDDAPDASVAHLVRAHGRHWAGSNHGLFVRDPAEGAWHRFDAPELSDAPVQAIYEDSDGNLWIGTIGGLARLKDGRLVEWIADDSPGAFKSVRAIYEDREGNLWLGSQWEGIARLWNGWTRRYGIREGLHEPVLWSLARGTDGRLWVGTHDGVALFEDGRFRELVPGDALPHPNAYSLLPEADRTWIGTRRGLATYEAGRLSTPGGFEALAGAQVNGFVRDADGALWIASTQGVYRHDGRRLHHYGTDAGLADPRVRTLKFLPGGRLLVGSQVGLYERSGDRMRPVGRDAGLPEGIDVTAIHSLEDGTLVVGTLSEELFVLAGGEWLRLGREQGVPGNAPFFITDDGDGMLWVGGIRGVYRVPIQDIRGFAAGRLQRVRGEMLLNERGDRRSGQKGFCCNGAGLSKGFIEDDQLWLPSRNGVVVLDTDGIVRNPVPPTVVVERIRTDAGWRDAAAVAGTALPADARDLGFEFTALSFQEPGSIGLRYRLRGYDAQWQEVDDAARRSANYTNLPPGDYVFEVMGSNNADVWQARPARLAFSISPRFHETGLFLALLALLLSTALFAGFRALQIRHGRQRAALEALVQQRTAALEVANQRLEEASQTDPLTGLRNRRYLANQIPADLSFYGRELGQRGSGQVMLFALIDIDHFKAVNDTHGHRAGDQVLQQFAQVLARLVRGGDYLVRWGGEEFLLVFRPMPGRHLATIGERIRHAVASQPFHVGADRPLRLTCSIGLAEHPLFLGGGDAMGWEATVELADLALYLVKSRSRDGWAAFRPTATTDPGTVLQELREDSDAMLRRGRIALVRSEPRA
jgi:diguanylate cyclase (GGDEF)-like protein